MVILDRPSVGPIHRSIGEDFFWCQAGPPTPFFLGMPPCFKRAYKPVANSAACAYKRNRRPTMAPPLRESLIAASNKKEFTSEAGTHVSNVPTVWAALFVFSDHDRAVGFGGEASNSVDGLAGAILLRDLDGFYEPVQLFDSDGKLQAAWLKITERLAKQVGG